MAYDLADLKSRADAAALAAGVPASLFENLIGHESEWNAAAVGTSGEIGLVQIMPCTASQFSGDPHNIDDNLMMGAQYLKKQFDAFGNWTDALQAYNGSKGTTKGPTYSDAILQGLDPKTGQAVSQGWLDGFFKQIGIDLGIAAKSIDPNSTPQTAGDAVSTIAAAAGAKSYLSTGAMYAGTGVILAAVLLLGLYLTAAGAKNQALAHKEHFL